MSKQKIDNLKKQSDNMKKQRNLKFEIDNGMEFFADEASVMHNPLRIFIDFKRITPRVDVRNNEFQPIMLRHNLIMMDPFVAKRVFEMLRENLANYEKVFGKIKKPEAIERAEKKSKSVQAAKDGNAVKEAPSYFG